MKVLYYTATPFLDIAIEIINILKNECELYVLIEVTPSTAHRVGIDILPENETIIISNEILTERNYKYFRPYLEGCASTSFIVNSSETGFSFSTLKVFQRTWQFINKIKPDILHVESISLRSFGLIPFLFSKVKIFFTIHDPIPHSGESNWKVSLPRLLFLRIPYSRGYFFYSQFAKNQFGQHFKKDKYPKYLLRMYPYSIYKQYIKEKKSIKKHILFFGSLSYYKGVNVLLKAMPSVFKKFPNESLIVAGGSNDNYNVYSDIPTYFKDRIVILDKYISNEDLVDLINKSKFVVCPYLEATQSGVLMAAYAFDTPVVASNVGAFSEYIEHKISGLLVPANDPEKLSDAINLALTNSFYKTMEANIRNINASNQWIKNLEIISDAYFQWTQK